MTAISDRVTQNVIYYYLVKPMAEEIQTPSGMLESEATPQGRGESRPAVSGAQGVSPTSGRRQAFRDLRRQLSDEDLQSRRAKNVA